MHAVHEEAEELLGVLLPGRQGGKTVGRMNDQAKNERMNEQECTRDEMEVPQELACVLLPDREIDAK